MSRLPGLRGDRWARRAETRRARLWVLATLIWALVVAATASVLAPDPAGNWLTAAQLAPLAEQLVPLAATAVAGAVSAGQANLVVNEGHLSALVHGALAGQGPIEAAAVRILSDRVLLVLRVRLAGNVTTTMSMLLAPSLVGEALFLSVQRAWLGRCPLPTVAWRWAVQGWAGSGAIEGLGWTEVAGRVGYRWDAAMWAGDDIARIREVYCTGGRVEILLIGGSGP